MVALVDLLARDSTYSGRHSKEWVRSGTPIGCAREEEGAATDPSVTSHEQEAASMRLRKMRRLERATGKTVTVQMLWIKVRECPTPISIELSLPYVLQSGDSLELVILADELINQIGTFEPELSIEEWQNG